MSHPGGRPPLFDSAESLERKVKEYYQYCEDNREHLTITGLALYLGFESRQSLYDYEKNDKFSYIIKAARLKVENDYEKRLATNSVTGAIFALKNMGWSDRQEIESTNKNYNMEVTPTPEEAAKIKEALDRSI